MTPFLPDHRLAVVAATQLGCFTEDQALTAGFEPATIRGRLRRGIWRVVYPGVYAATTTPQSRAVAASAARLRVGTDTMFSNFTGARLLGMDIRHDDPRVWLRAQMSSGLRDWPGVRVTRSRHDVDPVVAHGQPVVPPARTIVDVCGDLDESRLTGLLYDVTRRRMVTGDEVAAEAESVGGGAKGLRVLRDVLAKFDPAHEAMVEAMVGEALAAAGLLLTPQVEVWDGPFLAARLDFADEELKLGVEVDGFRYHGSREAQRRDRARDRMLRALGWTIIRVDASEALGGMTRVVADVLAVHRKLASERRLVG